MYAAQTDSPATELLGDIDASSTSFHVKNPEYLPTSVPFLMTIGFDASSSETVIVTAVNGDELTVIRGADGPALSWIAKSKCARMFTAKDLNDLQTNVLTLLTNLNSVGTKVGTAVLTTDASDLSAAINELDASIINLALSLANEYDEETQAGYSVGDYCIHDDRFYQCNTDIPAGGETWTVAHWTAVNFADLVTGLASGKLDASAYTNFTGATAQEAGSPGKVPAPAAGGNRYLSSTGAWQVPDTAPASGSDKLITSGAVYNAVIAIMANFTGVYSSSATYAVGSYCLYGGSLYRCVTAIATAEAWTAAHWTATTVGAELLALSASIAANTSAENITFDSSAASHTAGSVAAAIANLNSLVSTAQTNITKLTARTDIEAGSVTLTNNQTFPFNSSQVTVPLVTTRANQNYIVDYEVTAAVGNVGDIIVSAKLVNGFKIEYTGSATSVTVKYQVLGGMA